MVLRAESPETNMTEQSQLAEVASEKHSLYLRFPKKLNADRTLAESEVKALNSKIIRVRIPRQRSANFCLVDFASKEDQQKAETKLKKVKVNDRALVVKQAVRNDKSALHKKIDTIKVKREVNEALGKLVGDIKTSLTKNYAKRNVTNGVIVRGLQSGVTQSDIKRTFPEAIDVKLNVKADRKNSFALIWLPTPRDATEATADTVSINGEEYAVSLENEGKRKKRKRMHDSNDSSEEGESATDEDEASGSDVGEDGDDDSDDVAEGDDDDVDVSD